MSTRDELAADLSKAFSSPQSVETVAGWLIAEGWRKKPSEAELVRALMNAEVFVNDGDGQWEAPMEKEAERIATTVLVWNALEGIEPEYGDDDDEEDDDE